MDVWFVSMIRMAPWNSEEMGLLTGRSTVAARRKMAAEHSRGDTGRRTGRTRCSQVGRRLLMCRASDDVAGGGW
jgi:hypothetical protein